MKKLISLVVMISLLGVFLIPTWVMASNSGTQNASTSVATTISLKAQNYTSDVTTITFPTGVPGDAVTAPYNNVDGSGSPQIFGIALTAKPVVTLVNSGSIQYNIWYNISTFSNSVVANEYYLINAKGAACANAAAITNAVTFGADTNSLVTIAATGGDTAQKDLYLKITLGASAGVSGTSTITILGEN